MLTIDGDRIVWSNEKRRLSDLKGWSGNARQVKVEQAERLIESLEEFGQVHAICIEPDGGIVDGHQRNNVWRAAERFGPGYEVDVRVASRFLTEDEKRKLSVFLHQGAFGEWDVDELASWGAELDLLSWGMEEWQLGIVDAEADEELLNELMEQAQPQLHTVSLTFSLTDEQRVVVEQALEASKDAGPFTGTGNEDDDGNALARVCETYIASGMTA